MRLNPLALSTPAGSARPGRVRAAARAAVTPQGDPTVRYAVRSAIGPCFIAAAVTLGCHDTPGVPEESRAGLPVTELAPWATRPLCETYFFVSNQAVGAEYPLGVQGVREQAGPQVLELSPIEEEAPHAHLWDLFEEMEGAYSLLNPRAPFNYLSVALEARGANNAQLDPSMHLPDSSGDALQWRLSRAEGASSGRFDEVWFELVPVTNPSVALTASPTSRALSLEPRSANVPQTMLWSFQEYENCSQ